MQCTDCPWMRSLEDSAGDFIHICVQKDSPAYLEQTGYLGNCSWDGYEALSPLYHVTRKSNIPNILREGLQPSPEALYLSSNKKPEDGIHVFTDTVGLGDAMCDHGWISFYFNNEFGQGEDRVVLEIKLPVSWVSDVKMNHSHVPEATIRREIPADYIRFLNEDMDELDVPQEGVVYA